MVPALAGSWSRATIGLEHPARPGERRPVTFDHELARNRTDVVLAHLGPSARADGACAAARRGVGHGPPPASRHLRYADRKLAAPVAVAHGRLVITGASGHRLHEELIFAGVRLDRERPERLGVQETEAALALAHDAAVPGHAAGPAGPAVRSAADALRAALQARAGDRARQLTATLAGRARDEQAHVEATLSELAATIRREALGEDGDQLQLITGLELDAGDRVQVERDLRSLARGSIGSRSEIELSRRRSRGATPTRPTGCSRPRSRCSSRKERDCRWHAHAGDHAHGSASTTLSGCRWFRPAARS